MDFFSESSLLHNLEKSQMMAEMGVVRQDLQRTVKMVQEQVSHYILLNKIQSYLFPRATVEMHFSLTKWKSSNINTKDSAKISPLELGS